MTADDIARAYRVAVACPFHVNVYADWSARLGVTVGFQTEDEARTFASLRPEPLIDLCARYGGVIANRRMLAFPSGRAFPYRDDFPDTRP